MPITILLKNSSTPGLSDLPTALALGRSENPGVIGIHNLPLLVDIGLTDLPKIWGYHGTPGTPRDDRPVGCRLQSFDQALK